MTLLELTQLQLQQSAIGLAIMAPVLAVWLYFATRGRKHD